MELKVEYDDSLPDDLTILRTKSHHSYVDKVSQLFEDPFPSNMIITQEGSSFSPIELNQIHFFFTENKAVYANTESGKQKVQERLYEIESRLPNHFVRISRFEIVNLQWVKRFEYTFGGRIILHLKSDEKLYSTRSYTKKIKNILFRK
ncbi:LytTR family DNA-binding domain-containing protein [Alkalibacillus almallahensis]|uniref:LytTR family DNA-binding domain-containing protein n=1 Tax=Alkalibacillus almallahensis TaxID=1379154 RepID=UPI00141ED114|nr:LytTR family DNA-binding domain-containing protein [Alkalibacillus almallahensis]NIK11646.1 DNA-binding LytR/AlgR family response regulator [Alkalibacillus almallahensis]